MIGIYHNKDLDGICCGAIMKLAYPEIKLYGLDYGDEPPKNPNRELVFICDLSFPKEIMAKIRKESGSPIVWIDHHISAIKELVGGNEGTFFISSEDCKTDIDDKNTDVWMKCILDSKRAACEIAWEYFLKNSSVNEEMPRPVSLLGKYDTYRNQDKYEWENAILPFQYGMRMVCKDVESFPKTLITGSFAQHNLLIEIIAKGKTVLEYQKKQNKRSCKYLAFEAEFEGLRAICMNIGGGNSLMFESVYNEEKHDLMIPFVFSGKHWTYSLFTTKENIDCSEIAKKYGGGGHKKAAGFNIDKLLLDRERKLEETEESWDFWKEIVLNKDGSINIEQIKLELEDFYHVMKEVPKVYCHITGGMLSKINYYAADVISEADDYQQKLTEEAIEEYKENIQ